MRRQAGFTLVELLVTLAVIGLFAGTVGLIINQTIATTETGSEESTINYELQNVSYWFHRDVQNTAGVSTAGQLVLTQADDTTITYTHLGQDLVRQSAGPTLTLSQNVVSANFSSSGRIVSMTLEIAPAGRQDVSRESTLSATMRPSP